MKTYRIFISHSWAYKEQYKSLIRTAHECRALLVRGLFGASGRSHP